MERFRIQFKETIRKTVVLFAESEQDAEEMIESGSYEEGGDLILSEVDEGNELCKKSADDSGKENHRCRACPDQHTYRTQEYHQSKEHSGKDNAVQNQSAKSPGKDIRIRHLIKIVIKKEKGNQAFSFG